MLQVSSRAFGLLLLVVPGCQLGLDVDGANVDQRYLCEEDGRDEWNERLAECRKAWEEDESCAGMFSYEGQLDGQPVIYGGELTVADFKTRVLPDDSVIRGGLNIAGDAPSYEFEMKIIDLGVPVGQETDIPPFEAAPVADDFEDSIADASFRMSNGFQSRDSRVVEGILVVNRYNDLEFEADFHMAFGSHENSIDGCIHALATIFSTENLDDPTGDDGETGY